MALVLAVAEDPSAAELLHSLHLFGHGVIVVADAMSAIEAVASARPDIVLFAWSMVNMSALEAMRELEARGLRNHVRVMLMTSRTGETEIMTAYQVGFDAVVGWPVTGTKLDEAITDVLIATPEALQRRREEEVRRARLLAAIEGESEE